MVINSLNVNKSVGPDGISNKMLQLAGPYISQSLVKFLTALLIPLLFQLHGNKPT